MPLEALLISDNLTDSDSDGIDGCTDCNFIFLLCRLLVVGPVLKWLALFMYLFIYLFFITVLTTCSRPSIEMVAFIIINFFFSVFTPLARPY